MKDGRPGGIERILSDAPGDAVYHHGPGAVPDIMNLITPSAVGVGGDGPDHSAGGYHGDLEGNMF